MATDLRPVVTEELVREALSQYIPGVISDLVPVEGGNVARTFAFRQNDADYIVRFNDDVMMGSNLSKEASILSRVAAAGVPVAPLLYVGRLGERHFAISRRMSGRGLNTLTIDEVRQLVPELIELLATIHAVDVSDTQGYGVFNTQGVGYNATWREMFSRIFDEEDESEHGYYGRWHRLFDETFLERDLYEKLYQDMLHLLDSCPDERFLVHGGYDLSNILAQDGKITAVLDWLGAAYGDGVYDIARLDFWTPLLDVPRNYQLYCQDHGIALPAYEERLLCYQCYTALVALRFYAKARAEQSYRWTRQRILELLDR